MLDIILQTIEKFDIINYLSKIKNSYVINLSKTEKEIFNKLVIYFEKNSLIDNETAALILNKSKVNTRKYFKKFVDAGLLLTIGNNKGRKYRLNADILILKKEITSI